MADHGAEKPREIILTACSAIADQLSKDGFSFLKSGPKLKRKARDLTRNIVPVRPEQCCGSPRRDVDPCIRQFGYHGQMAP
ncbi:MAG: hypothetical protein J7517_12220 [Sphingobium yanoikuyae]|uniref:hypothetical protein n=1 Tax=Sphingobium yanoikuyae TaxID=13690 RepID=UPI001B2E06D6|nr:hypothetical protein [Sphingobium yanoikuyae]